MSYAIAFFIGLTFVMLAHFLGIQLLRMGTGRPLRRFLRALFAVGLVALAGIAIYTLYEMRGQVAELTGGQVTAGAILPGADAEVQRPASKPSAPPKSLWQTISDNFTSFFPWNADPAEAGRRYAQFGLLLLNIMVFSIGTILSYYRHDPDPDLERTWQEFARFRRTLAAYKKRYQARLAELEERYARDLTAIERRKDQEQEEMKVLQAERARLMESMKTDVRIVVHALATQIAAYQKGNVQTRKSNPPAYFGHIGMSELGKRLASKS